VGEKMEQLQWYIEGRRFRNKEEYEAALRDKSLIESITKDIDLDNPKDVEKLYMELKNGKYEFESIAGRKFDDNVYELYMKIKEDEEKKAEEKRHKQEKRQQEIENLKYMIKNHGRKPGESNERVRFEDLDRDMQKRVIMEMRKKEKRRKLIIAACVLVGIASFGYLRAYLQAAAKSAQQFEELAEIRESEQKNTAGQATVVVHLTSKEIPDVLPEYETLIKMNENLIGWVKIDDTIIDYPVMQTSDNEYYLDHNFNGESDNNGCIFMDYQCDVVEGCDNIILYGHHMKSGKMFGGLNKYSKQSYYEEHPTIQFDTIYEKGVYQVMYVFRSKVYSEEDVNFKYYQFINAGSDKEFDSYMNEMAELSLYDTGVTASYGDKLLTLSTCDYQESKGRFVVVAKKVS
jgi:sortase B